MRRAFLSLAVLIALTALAVASPQYGAQQGAAQNVRFTGGSVQNVTDTTATLTWNTNVQSSAIVKYGTDRNNLSQTAEAPWGGPNHTVTISGLQPNTTYFFQVTSGQAEGTGSQAVREIYQFRTKPSMGARGGVFGQTTQAQTSAASSQSGSQAQITNGPVVEGTTPTTAVIAWTTNVNSGTTIKYGTDPNSLSQTAEMPWGGITHTVDFKNLKPRRS